MALGLKEIGDWGRGYCVKALVKNDNRASIRVFESLGFSKGDGKDFNDYTEFKIEI